MTDPMLPRFGRRVDVRPFFAADRRGLTELLPTLTDNDWQASTAAGPWRVRDVVAHIIGDDVARLARTRDGHPGPGPTPGEALASFLHRHNAEWVAAHQRVSVRTLLDLLEVTTSQILKMWYDLDLGGVGEQVSWVADEPAPIWLDCGRDFTEYWIHQQQIRDAVGRPRHLIRSSPMRSWTSCSGRCPAPCGTSPRRQAPASR